MSKVETALVFAGIPLLVVLAVYGAVYGTAARRVGKRYRPGRPFTFAPVWFLAGTESGRSAAPALGTGEHAALPGGPLLAQVPDAAPTDHGATGGASDRW